MIDKIGDRTIMSEDILTQNEPTATNFMGPVALSEAAAVQFRKKMASENKEGWGIRVAVQGGGCSGMSYFMELTETPQAEDKIFQSQGLQIICDMKSWFYLRNMTIDFDDDLLMGGFRFHNPNAKSSCGCGTSFSA